MKTNNAVVTLAIGEGARRIGAMTAVPMLRHAAKWGADFVSINAPRLNLGHPKFEKFQIFDLLERYDRILYLDVDIIINNSCPNVFNESPEECFAAFYDSEVKDCPADKPEWREEEIRRFQEKNGDIGWEKTYFNSGVMLVHARHRKIFDYSGGVRRSDQLVDQTQLNYNAIKLGVPWFDLGRKYNHFVALSASQEQFETRFSAYILHYAGYDTFYKAPSLYERIAEDCAILGY